MQGHKIMRWVIHVTALDEWGDDRPPITPRGRHLPVLLSMCQRPWSCINSSLYSGWSGKRLKTDTFNDVNRCTYLYRYLILTTNLAACVCVCLCVRKILPISALRSYFVSKRPENFVRIAKFPYAAFGPLFAFHCPLFFTRNNHLQWKSSPFAVVVSPHYGR